VGPAGALGEGLRPGRPACLSARPGAGAHGFRIDSLSGSIALAALDGSGLEFVVNLGQLKARVIELGDHGSDVPAGI
jgi:hypothetical protein